MPISKKTKYAIAWKGYGLLPVGGRGSGTSPFDFRQENAQEPKRIGVLAQWGIGDAVLAMPLLRGLRARYPEASLELLGKNWLPDLFKDTNLCDATHRLVPPWTKYSGKYRFWDSDWRRFRGELRALKETSFDWLVSIRHDPREILQLRMLNAAFKAGYGGGRNRGLDFDLGVPPHLTQKAHMLVDAGHASRMLTGDDPEPRPVFRVSKDQTTQALDRIVAAGYQSGLIVAVSWGEIPGSDERPRPTGRVYRRDRRTRSTTGPDRASRAYSVGTLAMFIGRPQGVALDHRSCHRQ